jgi:hypothetical protein
MLIIYCQILSIIVLFGFGWKDEKIAVKEILNPS